MKSLTAKIVLAFMLIFIIHSPVIGQESPPVCQPHPIIPDCSGRGRTVTLDSQFQKSDEWSCAPDNLELRVCSGFKDLQCRDHSDCVEGELCLPIPPSYEIFLSANFNYCCGECCPDGCDTRSGSCSLLGGSGAEWLIRDQNLAQLNWDVDAFLEHTDTMWDRGVIGACGNPNTFEVERIQENTPVCWNAVIDAIKRPGWNFAGTNFFTAMPIDNSPLSRCLGDHLTVCDEDFDCAGVGGPCGTSTTSWCGNLNETPCGGSSGGGSLECNPEEPECTTDHFWKVFLNTGDTLEVATKLKGWPFSGNLVRLGLYDNNRDFIRFLFKGFVGEEDSHFLTHTNNESSQNFYIKLNNTGDINGISPGADLWEYAIKFGVQEAGCVRDGACETCNNGECVPLPDGTSCSDENICTTGDFCLEGVCTGGEQVVCVDDNNPCTGDICDPVLGCQVPDGTSCEDGQLCNGKETCEDGLCIPGATLTAEDLDNLCLSSLNDAIAQCQELNNWKMDILIANSKLGERNIAKCFGGGTTPSSCASDGVHGGLLYQEKFIRRSGEPIREVRLFEALEAHEGKIIIINGSLDDNKFEKVSYTTISFNGKVIVAPGEINKSTDVVEIPVEINAGNNKLAVQLHGKRGGALIIEAIQDEFCVDGGTPTAIKDSGDFICSIDDKNIQSVCELNCTGCLAP